MASRNWNSTRWVVPALVAASCLVLPESARSDHFGRTGPQRTRADRAAVGDLISVEVQVDGRWVPLLRAPGVWDRRYFQAEHGENYALRVRNRTDRRVGVLISVDGVNVVNGERSSLSAQEPMYVLDGRETATIRGWRTSLDDVREFVFVDEHRSYASRTGQANGDMGWVRVLAFEERRPIAWYRPHERWQEGSRKGDDEDERAMQGAPSAPQKGGDMAQGRTEESFGDHGRSGDSYPGTGWGDRRRDRVRETWFEPVARASDQIVLRYEYEQALVELGIFTDWDRLGDREHGEWRFAQPPRR